MALMKIAKAVIGYKLFKRLIGGPSKSKKRRR